MNDSVCPDTYECAACGGVFHKGWSDEEAKAEFEEVFPDTEEGEPTSLICDDCYQKFMGWAASARGNA